MASSGCRRDGIRGSFAFCLHAHASRRGGSDPQRAWPSAEGAGARIREIRGVAPPLPGTPLMTPDAAEFAASLRTSRATKPRRRNDFAGATLASRSVGTHRRRGRQRGQRGASVLRACRPLSRRSQSFRRRRTDDASLRRNLRDEGTARRFSFRGTEVGKAGRKRERYRRAYSVS